MSDLRRTDPHLANYPFACDTAKIARHTLYPSSIHPCPAHRKLLRKNTWTFPLVDKLNFPRASGFFFKHEWMKMKLPIASLDGVSCRDLGIQGLADMDPRSPLYWFVWVGVGLATERLLTTIPLLWRVRDSWTMTVYPYYSPPYAVLALWNVFTALSIILVATTFRSSLSVVFKTAHVATEAYFLAFMLYRQRLRIAAATATVAALVVVGFVLSFSCIDTMTIAAVSGLVMDSTNVIVHIIVGFQQPSNTNLWRTIHGFAWHALYLLTYIGIQRWNISMAARAYLRVFGMLFNNIALYVFVHLLRRVSLPMPGTYRWSEWQQETRKHDLPCIAWRDFDTLVWDGAEEGELVSLHAPCEVAYAEEAVRMSIFNVAWTGWRHAVRMDRTTARIYSWCVPVTTIDRVSTNTDENKLRVPSFALSDIARTAVAVLVSTALFVSSGPR